MILAQNLLRPLNGNKLFGFLLIGMLIFSSCDSLRKAQTTTSSNNEGSNDKEELPEIKGKKVYNPETGKFEVLTKSSEVDTVKWTDVPQEEAPPIVTEGSGKVIEPKHGAGDTQIDPGNKMNEYNVAVMLPFLGHKFQEFESRVNPKSELALDFYSGVKIAFEDLSNEGIRLNVSVHDSEASEATTTKLLKTSELYQAQMIVGPVKSSNLKKVADYAKQNKKVLVSPLSPSSKVTTANPYYVQVNPSLKSHCQAITRHALDRYPAGQIVLACRNKSAEVSRLKFFQEAHQEFVGSSSVDKFKEFIITDQSVDFNEMDVSPYIQDGKTTVFIVPSWSNKTFVYALLRQIKIAKGPNNVVVYGMPQWMENDRIAYDYLNDLNVHISSASNINTEKAEIQSFRQRYFDRYGQVPATNSYIGYDVMMYFGRMMAKHGTSFQQAIDREAATMLHSTFNFEPVAPKNANVENYDAIEYYENKKVNILKFADYYYQLAE